MIIVLWRIFADFFTLVTFNHPFTLKSSPSFVEIFKDENFIFAVLTGHGDVPMTWCEAFGW